MQSDCDDTMKKPEDSNWDLLRNRPDSLIAKPRHIYSDPPWVAKQLAFTIERQKYIIIDLTHQIKNRLSKGLFEEAEDFTKELSVMINADPRLGDLLQKNFLELLIQCLKHDKRPKLQMHAATILKPLVVCPTNKDVVMAIEHITPAVVNLVRSQEYLVRLQALWLLRNMIPTIPKSVLQEALVPVTSYLVNGSTGYVVLNASAQTLLYSIQEYPNLSLEKLKLALPALLKLIKSDILTILTSASWGLTLLCDGREEMVVEDNDLDCLIERLLDLINADERIMIISGLNVLGSIVRWGSDNAIEAIIRKKDTLPSLMCLLKDVDMFYVRQACWIISNITARKEEHVKAVIDCKLVDPLFNVLQNDNLVDVKREALWAISNAMCGVGSDKIECLRKCCSKVSWGELLLSWIDCPLLFVTLEGLTNIKLVEVTCNRRPIDAIELHYIFTNIVYQTGWTKKFKNLRRNDNVQISDDTVKYNLAFEVQKDMVFLYVDSLLKLVFFSSRPIEVRG